MAFTLPIELKATRKLKNDLLEIRREYVYDPREKSKDVVDEFRAKAMPIINELNKRMKKTWEGGGSVGTEPSKITFKDYVQK